MVETRWLAQQFAVHPVYLRGVASGVLGCLSDGDNAVREAWLPRSRRRSDVAYRRWSV
jgi:hypothetical protein